MDSSLPSFFPIHHLLSQPTMDTSLMVQQSAVPKPELFPVRQLFSVRLSRTRITFNHVRSTRCKLAVRATIPSGTSTQSAKIKPLTISSPTPLFVGLPLDVVSDTNTPNHSKAVAAGLRALKLLGADGVDLPISWAIIQPTSPDQFDWSGYLAVAAAARDAGLRLRVTLQFNTLPKWVTDISNTNPDILFTDRSGRRYPGCLSLSVDDLPVLDGATPMSAYHSLLLSFRTAFAHLIGTTVTDVTIGLGPDGQLRYPSFPSTASGFTGVGEFQCYGKYTLESLRAAAEAAGNPLWGLGGPHDAPKYTQSPDSGFFSDNGSWETEYGKFFLSWYSGQLIDHANRVLTVAADMFNGLPVKISGKVPLLHHWYNMRSRPALVTAGYYHTELRDGFDAVAEVFSRNSCNMVIPGMDIAEQDVPKGLRSSPEGVLSAMMNACERHGVWVAGENSSAPVGVGAAERFRRIKENMMRESVVSFTYQRMGAYFFSPEHWPRFTEFVRGLAVPELEGDDVLGEEAERVALPMGSVAGRDREMQAV